MTCVTTAVAWRVYPEVELERKQAKDFLYKKSLLQSVAASEKEDAERVVSDLFGF